MYFWLSKLIACIVAWPAIHCYSFFMYFFFYFNNFFLFSFPVNAVLQLHTFSLIYCIADIVIVCHSVHSLMALSGNKRITYLLTYLHDITCRLTNSLHIYNVRKLGNQPWKWANKLLLISNNCEVTLMKAIHYIAKKICNIYGFTSIC